jgi:cation-transporting ATPase 13A1
MATCHTLINLDDEIIGDPLEKVTLETIDWTVTKNESVVPKKTTKNTNGWKIYHRFHFSSALKRMSVIAGHTKAGGETSYIATCKGAPEVLKSMVSFCFVFKSLNFCLKIVEKSSTKFRRYLFTFCT